jgi:hypothetical protein
MRALILLLLWPLAGCDECVEGETACRGDGIASCVRGRFREVFFCCAQDGCRDVEVDGSQQAVCSPTDRLDPRCDGAAAFENRCVDGARLTCNFGYSGFEEHCAVACVEAEPDVALCAVSPMPDPRCAGFERGTFCNGNSIVECAFGFVTSDVACTAPFDSCMLVPDNLGGRHPACATPTADPGCETDSPGRCDGLDIVGCRGGRRTIEHCVHGCYENPIDSRFPEAFCEGPPCHIE